SNPPAAIRMHRFTLAFDDAATEALYRASHRPRFRGFAIGSAILVGVWLAFSGWAALVIPADSPGFIKGVLGGIVPLIVGCTIACAVARGAARDTLMSISGPLTVVF